jgi:SAM-dependent methyltransferase
MPTDRKPGTAAVNGRLWGARARDWAELQEGQCRPLFETVLARLAVGPATTYCDVGCGSGLAARLAADLGARVHALDASDALLAIARERVPAGDFRVGDLEALPFASAAFDLVTGFNAFQFAADPSTALSEARRVAKPGAHVVIATWGKPEGMEAAALVAATKPLLPAPPPNAPGPFALSDETALRAFAARAGLRPLDVFDVDCVWTYGDLDTGVRALGSTGVAARAIETSGEDAVTRAHANALRRFGQPDGTFRVRATFRCLTTRV